MFPSILQLSPFTNQELLRQFEQTEHHVSINTRNSDRERLLMRFPTPTENAFGRLAELQFVQNVVDILVIDRPPTATVVPFSIKVDYAKGHYRVGSVIARNGWYSCFASTAQHCRIAIYFPDNNSRLTHVPVIRYGHCSFGTLLS